jgi:anti-sigma factor RsiW
MNPDLETQHPLSEEWMDYLYTELTPDRQAELHRHLGACPACRGQVERWRATLALLDTWQVGASRPATHAVPNSFKWALAAALVLGLGLAAGRLTAPQPDLSRLRAQLVAPLRAELQREFEAQLQTVAEIVAQRTASQIEDLERTWASTRDDDRQFNLTLYNRIRVERQADLAWLRRDLETVAVSADERLGSTERTLGLLASSTPSPRP